MSGVLDIFNPPDPPEPPAPPAPPPLPPAEPDALVDTSEAAREAALRAAQRRGRSALIRPRDPSTAAPGGSGLSIL